MRVKTEQLKRNKKIEVYLIKKWVNTRNNKARDYIKGNRVNEPNWNGPMTGMDLESIMIKRWLWCT